MCKKIVWNRGAIILDIRVVTFCWCKWHCHHLRNCCLNEFSANLRETFSSVFLNQELLLFIIERKYYLHSYKGIRNTYWWIEKYPMGVNSKYLMALNSELCDCNSYCKYTKPLFEKIASNFSLRPSQSFFCRYLKVPLFKKKLVKFFGRRPSQRFW